jgi:hypothetical protein
MKKTLSIAALALSMFFAGTAAAQTEPPQPEPDAQPVDEQACNEATQEARDETPPPSHPGIPHTHEGGECHHAIGTEDPNPNP